LKYGFGPPASSQIDRWLFLLKAARRVMDGSGLICSREQHLHQIATIPVSPCFPAA